MSCRSSLFRESRRLEFFFPGVRWPRETKATISIVCEKLLREHALMKSAPFQPFARTHICFARDFRSFIRSSLRARYDSDVTCTSLRGKATISGSLQSDGMPGTIGFLTTVAEIGWNALNRGRPGSRKWRDRYITYGYRRCSCLLLTSPRELTVQHTHVTIYCPAVPKSGISIRPRVRPAFPFFRSRKIMLQFTLVFIPR